MKELLKLLHGGKVMNEIIVGLVQINNSFSNQNYIPYSVGLLQAYTQKYAKVPEQYKFLLPIYCRMPVKKAVQSLSDASVIGFSAYVWNIKISLEIARRIKIQTPEVLIVFGGPQVPNQAEQFLRQHSFIDIVCHGEGEHCFLNILENTYSRDWENIPSVSFIQNNGVFVHHPKETRIKDISVIPSPFLEGVFEPLIKANPTEQWIGLWETNRGCPFSCTFCDWGSATKSKVFRFDMDRIFKEVEWFVKHQVEFIFCCDANFGILKRDVEIAQYLAETNKKYGYPKAFSIQSTKNATERSYQVQKILADANMNKGVSLSMQSVDAGTLKNIKRENISIESYQKLQHQFTKDKIETFTDIILALPGETYNSFFDGVSYVIENGQHNRIQFNNLSVLPNAKMGDTAYQKEYGINIVESKIINIHGSLIESEDEIYETQQLVIATNTMPKEDWCKTRVLSWMIAFLYFDKLLQIPLIVLHEECSISYRKLFEPFMELELDSFPMLSEIRNFFWIEAKKIQNGGEEFCKSEKWLNIWWPADEYIFIKLSVENNLDIFYQEAEKIFTQFLDEKKIKVPSALYDALLLNKSLINQPFQVDINLNLSYNVWGFYQGVLRGLKTPLEKKTQSYHINRASVTLSSWDDWCQEIVWYGNKKGAYLHKDITIKELN
jgi:radical SAM superfamily enzyme YgiQ (UPF0313 family)